MKTEVLVTGAGPVGLAMAAELARYGVSVRLIDQAAQRTDKSKALVIWSRTLELMDRMGCTAVFLQAGKKVSEISIFANGKQIAQVALGGVPTPYPYALMLPQSETERLLEEHLNHCGAQLERGVQLTSFTDKGEAVVSQLRHADGKEERIETSWLIGCDGAHSTVRHTLGMEFHGDTIPTNWILADVHLNGAANPNEVSIIWHADGILAIFPMSQDRYRVIADVGTVQGDKARPDPTLEEVQAMLDGRAPERIQASAPVWLATFRINERKVSDYQAGRVFLAGDAAHIHSPAGGQGMNTGIQDACNLGWKLALVIQGVCAAEPLLASYSIERSAIGDQVLKGTSRATSIGIMRGEIKQTIRNHIASLVFGLSSVRKAVAETVTEMSIAYPNSPLNGEHKNSLKGPAPGERAPIRPNEPPVGAGNKPRFVLFAELDHGATQIVNQYPDLLDPDVRAPFDSAGIWLMRPDGYTSLAAAANNWEEVSAFLARISGGGERSAGAAPP